MFLRHRGALAVWEESAMSAISSQPSCGRGPTSTGLFFRCCCCVLYLKSASCILLAPWFLRDLKMRNCRDVRTAGSSTKPLLPFYSVLLPPPMLFSGVRPDRRPLSAFWKGARPRSHVLDPQLSVYRRLGVLTFYALNSKDSRRPLSSTI